MHIRADGLKPLLGLLLGLEEEARATGIKGRVDRAPVSGVMKAEWNSSTIVAGRYEIRRLIGRGGMGAVYEAFDQNLGKTVAIKSLLGEIEPSQAQRFQLEATATGRLKHQNIVTVMDFGLTDTNQMYMVSEFVHGSTLAERVKSSGPLHVNEFVRIFAQICKGMQHAHDAGIVHRDLKPENIIIDDESMVKIVDFGLAKLVDLDGSLTRTGASVGSPYYMSPEQISADDIDQRSDIYSLGCVMFFCLEGRPPFKGSSAIATMQMHRDDHFPRLTKIDLDTEYGVLINELISGCVEKASKNRFGSMIELLEILESIAAVGPIEDNYVTDAGDVDRVDSSSAENTGLPVTPRTVAAVSMGALLLLIVGGIIFSSASEYINSAVSPPESPTLEKGRAKTESENALDLLRLKVEPEARKALHTEKFRMEKHGQWRNIADVTAADLQKFLGAERDTEQLQISEQFVSPDVIQILAKSNIVYLELRGITFRPGSLAELRLMKKLRSLRLALQHNADFDWIYQMQQIRNLTFDGICLEEQTPFVVPRLPKNVRDVGFFRMRNGVSRASIDELKSLPVLEQVDFLEVQGMDEERLARQLTSLKRLRVMMLKRVFFKAAPAISGLKLDRLTIAYEPIWTVKSLSKFLNDNHVTNVSISESEIGESYDNVDYLFVAVPSLQSIRDVLGTRTRPGCKQKPASTP